MQGSETKSKAKLLHLFVCLCFSNEICNELRFYQLFGLGVFFFFFFFFFHIAYRYMFQIDNSDLQMIIFVLYILSPEF